LFNTEKKETGRLIAIGDIHGHSNILRLLLNGIDPQPEDTIVFLGDYINRGPDSKGVVDQIISLRNKCFVETICGNHEEMLLGAYQGGKSDHNFWCKFGGKETLASYGVEDVRGIPGDHLVFFSKCLDYFETDDFIFVHAGYDPATPMDKSTGEVLRWDRLNKNVDPHFSGKTVVCGHSCQKQILDLGHVVCIDTGCGVWPGGRLSAIDLNSGKVWQAGGRSKKATIKQLDR
jgi:serine/threonine protein phosphatase 1